MERKALGRDLSLTLRMLFVCGILVAVYAAMIAVAAVLVVNEPTSWESWVIAGFPFLLLWAHYRSADRILLRAVKARMLASEDAPELHATVERLSAMVGVPKPRVALVGSQVPNAFAAGRSPRHAVVAVTTGLLETLDPAEVESVVAHEVAHIANRDALVMTFASYLQMWGAIMAGRRWRGEDYSKHRDLRERLVFALVKPFALLFYAFSTGLTLAVSRYREYAADRGSAILTGRPEQLMSALQKISGDMALIPRHDLRAVEGLNAFFIIPATAKGPRFEFLMDHPPLEKRLRELGELARELGRPVP
jgi:heat shock protein HtpX